MTSGVWAGLAVDLADTTFYRPVHSAEGFGGTRYMPLQFIVHAAFLSIMNRPAATAHAAVLLAGAALLSGLYRCLREFNLSTSLAWTCAAIAMAALTIQYALISTRGDLLAAALNVWGLAFCARCTATSSSRHLVFASIVFALAFMTKFTTVFGVVAALLWFGMNGRRTHAAMLGGLTAAFALSMLGIVHITSDGRALDSFLACAAGGTTLGDIAASPFKFLYAARVDPVFLIFFSCACVVFAKRRRPLSDLPSAWFLFTTLVTVFIMASPGTDLSHLIDLQVASVALTAVHISQSPMPRMMGRVLPVAGVVGGLITVTASLVLEIRAEDSRWRQQDRIMSAVGEGSAPMLADDPWVPILAGEHPFVLDTFAIRTTSEQRPEIAEDLFAKLEEHFFRAVVLFVPKHIRDSENATNGAWRGKRWYGELFYPPGFEEHLLNAYEPKAFIGQYVVLLPK